MSDPRLLLTVLLAPPDNMEVLRIELWDQEDIGQDEFMGGAQVLAHTQKHQLY